MSRAGTYQLLSRSDGMLESLQIRLCDIGRSLMSACNALITATFQIIGSPSSEPQYTLSAALRGRFLCNAANRQPSHGGMPLHQVATCPTAQCCSSPHLEWPMLDDHRASSESARDPRMVVTHAAAGVRHAGIHAGTDSAGLCKVPQTLAGQAFLINAIRSHTGFAFARGGTCASWLCRSRD